MAADLTATASGGLKAPRHDVSVIGLYILDVLGRPVTQLPERGNVDFIEEIRLTVAGTAGGTVVDTAKLGLKSLAVGAVGAVGNDEKAKFGTDTSEMQRLDGVPTSATILNVRPNGDRPALHVRGASDHFDVADDRFDAVFDAEIVHLGGTGLLRTLDGDRSRVLLSDALRARVCRTGRRWPGLRCRHRVVRRQAGGDGHS